MPDLSADTAQPTRIPANVLEYRRVEPVVRQISERTRRYLIGALITAFLFFAFLTAMTCQWSFPSDQHARNVENWMANELERRIYEREYRKGLASGIRPPVAAPVVVQPWASVLMTIGDGALILLALFSHRLARKFDRIKDSLLLTPQRIWNALLALSTVQLLLALACIGTDAWRVFTDDFVYVGWIWIGLLVTEFVIRISTTASLPDVLERMQFGVKANQQLMR